MNAYTVFGTINTLFIIISLYGVFSQLKTIWIRKRNQEKHQCTALLSLNQFTVSYFAYLSFFVYGYSIEPFNHFIVWPRLIASVLVSLILYEIWKDRRLLRAQLAFVTAVAALLCSLAGLVSEESMVDQGRTISTSIIVVVSVLIAQGYFHQVRLIVKSGSTGAVDPRMSQFILMMDLSTIAFAISMGLSEGWPLLVLAITSGITKLAILYMFRWVKTSSVALRRRTENAAHLKRACT